jgi:hypothetical protein
MDVADMVTIQCMVTLSGGLPLQAGHLSVICFIGYPRDRVTISHR